MNTLINQCYKHNQSIKHEHNEGSLTID
jgi:hypothetical protein